MANLQPLNWQVPLVNPDRTPTSEFQRAWASLQTAAGDIPALDTAAEVSAVLDKLGAAPGSMLHRGATGWQLITGANGDLLRRGASSWQLLPSPNDVTKFLAGDLTWQTISVPPPPSIQTLLDGISTTHGVVLYRGASGWVALAPGTSGYFLQTQGSNADPVWAAGGGGTVKELGYVQAPGSPSVSTSASATKGQLIRLYAPITVYAINVSINPMAVGNQFTGRILTPATLGSTTVSSVVATTLPFTYASGPTMATMAFATPVTLAAARDYLVVVSFTNAAADSTPIRVPEGTKASPLWANVPYDPGDHMSSYTNCYEIAKRVPAVGDTASAYSGTFSIGIEFSR